MLDINSAVLELLAAKPEGSFQGCHHHGSSRGPAGLVPEQPLGSLGIAPHGSGITPSPRAQGHAAAQLPPQCTGT